MTCCPINKQKMAQTFDSHTSQCIAGCRARWAGLQILLFLCTRLLARLLLYRWLSKDILLLSKWTSCLSDIYGIIKAYGSSNVYTGTNQGRWCPGACKLAAILGGHPISTAKAHPDSMTVFLQSMTNHFWQESYGLLSRSGAFSITAFSKIVLATDGFQLVVSG